MNTRLQAMRRRVRDHEHVTCRQAAVPDVLRECEEQHLSWPRRAARLVRRMCEAELPVIEAVDQIVFTRTVAKVPPVYGPKQWRELTAGRTLHELGPISNICADWGMVLSQGLLGRRGVAAATSARLADDPLAVEFLAAAVETIDAVLDLARRYADAARAAGRPELAEILEQVPARPPRTFHEALQSLRLMHAVVWLGGHYHVGLGRFDQYMWPYLDADLRAGRLDEARAEELLAEFFISLNRDSDLYPGVQQGDNGQSLMLGGLTREGHCGINPLTAMALRAARDVAMIDPKINLRITKDTDLELLTLAAELTAQGLGFPQYSNDDVVIPALVAHGYDLEDARDYTVAACWEFILPGKGMEVVNIGAVSMPAAVDASVRAGLAGHPLAGHEGFAAILDRTGVEIGRQLETAVSRYRHLLLPPAPYYSVLMDGCLESGRDLSQGLKYNNFGVHGACSASAADALAAVRKRVFVEKSVAPVELIQAMDANFSGHEPLRCKLLDAPKVGNHDDEADDLLATLFDRFAAACEAAGDNGRGGTGGRGGIVRPGTGSAMYYVWLAAGHAGMHEPVVGATADGRRAAEYFSANLAPSPGVRVRGPLSVLQSFSKLDYRRICNGGPITLELSDAVFADGEALRKVALLVRSFAMLGCQQLQLNTINVAKLQEAKRHPERHRNLIVRVWGWSGYFCELEEPYQDHVIARHAFALEDTGCTPAQHSTSASSRSTTAQGSGQPSF
ncbi:MAG: pyruvate formate lyase family protein [Thermoguttaceae bacterium]|jgi:formate C-acetyltransferase